MICRRLTGVAVLGATAMLLTGGMAEAADSGGAGTPVTAGVAEARDMPDFVAGLGAVQAFNAVTIRTRVDGQITQVLFKEGQDVKQGDRLFQIDPRPYQATLDQAIAAKARDTANLHAAQLDLDRYAALVGKGFQTRQSTDDQRGTVEADQAAVAADQAMIDSAKLNLDFADIRSPITGRTGARAIDIGNFVQASAATTLVTVTQIKPIYVSFTVPQERLEEIRLNQIKAPLEADAYSNDGKTKLAVGELTLIDNQVDASTGTIRLKAQFANEDELLWPGAFVAMRLVVSTRKNAVTVPAQTIMAGANGSYAYVIKPDNTVERRPVTVFATQDGVAVIKSGLQAGEKIVVEGQYRLTEGGKVNPNPPKPAAPSPAPAG